MCYIEDSATAHNNEVQRKLDHLPEEKKECIGCGDEHPVDELTYTRAYGDGVIGSFCDPCIKYDHEHFIKPTTT